MHVCEKIGVPAPLKNEFSLQTISDNDIVTAANDSYMCACVVEWFVATTADDGLLMV